MMKLILIIKLKKLVYFMINKNDKIFVAGHNGLVGSAIVRKLKEKKILEFIVQQKFFKR